MIQKKVVLLGLSGVGKTSLVHRFVYQAYSDRYLATLGVRIERRDLTVDHEAVQLLLWDIDGRHPRQERLAHVRGASGYLLVADGTRRVTVDAARELQTRVEATLGHVPFQLLINKVDLDADWQIDAAELATLTARGWSVWCTSAKSGQAVDEAFECLARTMLDRVQRPQ